MAFHETDREAVRNWEAMLVQAAVAAPSEYDDWMSFDWLPLDRSNQWTAWVDAYCRGSWMPSLLGRASTGVDLKAVRTILDEPGKEPARPWRAGELSARDRVRSLVLAAKFECVKQVVCAVMEATDEQIERAFGRRAA